MDDFLQSKPVSDDDTKDVQCKLNGNELPSRRVRSGFGSLCTVSVGRARQKGAAVERTQTGTMTLSMPVPMPLTKRAANLQFISVRLPCKYLTADHPVWIHRRGLQTGSNDAPYCTKSHDFYTTNLLADPSSQHAPHECSEVVHRDLQRISLGMVNRGREYLQCHPEGANSSP